MPLDALAGKTLLGRYRVVMSIGRGGMGAVYLARTEGAAGFAKPVVIKSVHAELLGDPTMVQLFVREARLLSNLHHPGIVNVLDFGDEGGTYVMVLEYVHGYDLGAWLRYREQVQLPFFSDDALHVAVSVLDTLTYTHNYRRADGTRLSIVHRDVSPGNILISLDGQVKLADFGIARAADDAGEYRSRVGTFKGKIAYSAPELVQGGEPTPSADVYSLAVVVLQILLGENPFRGQNMGDTVQRVLTVNPPSLAQRRPDLPPAIDRVLARALAKDPRERYGDAAELAHELRRLRVTDDEVAHRNFAEHVRADFEGNLPIMLSLDPLVERDAAWRQEMPGISVGLSSTPPAMRHHAGVEADATTAVVTAAVSRFDAVTVRPADPDAARRGGRRRRLALAVGGVLVAGAIAGGLLLALRPRPAPLVGSAYHLADPSSDALGPTPRPPELASAAAAAAPSGSGSVAGGTAPAEVIAAALAERQPDVERCFETHVEQLTGAPEIGLRFQLRADGTVRDAELSPATLSATPLGGCLLTVARATRFPPLGRDLSFRLPITAHVSR